MVFISGQVAWDENMDILGKNDLEKQTEQSIINPKNAIQATSGSQQDVAMLRIYIVNYHQDEGPIISQILSKYFSREYPPSSTWINVKGSANEEFLIEAQAII